MATALARGVARAPGAWQGPSWVTLARATLAVGVAALVADSFARDTPVALLVALAAVALSLDLVDGWLARRTGHRDRAGRALRRRGRRVPDPRAQRLRRPHRTARGCSRSARRATCSSSASGCCRGCARRSAAPLAQGRRGRAGDRAHGRGGRRPAPGGHGGDPPRRARRSRGVRGRVRVVAVAPPARRDRAAPRRPAGRRRRRSRCSPLLLVWAALVAPNQLSELDAGAFVRLPLELLVVLVLAVLLRRAAPRAGRRRAARCWRCSWW